MDVFCIDSVNIVSIECIRDPCLCIDNINIYSINDMIEKPSVSAFQNFLRIKNWLNIKKVIGRNVWMCFVSTALTYNNNNNNNNNSLFFCCLYIGHKMLEIS